MYTKTDLAWCAGLFDGEGCISIGAVAPAKRNDLVNTSYRLTVKVTMCDLRTIKRFHSIMGVGTVQKHQPSNPRCNASWSWVAMSRLAEKALLKLQPWIVTKKNELSVALQFMALPDAERGGARGSPCIDRKLLRKKHAFYVRCCKLKPRFKFRRHALVPFVFRTPQHVH